MSKQKVEIDLPQSVLDMATKKYITKLERKIHNLETKVQRRDDTIARLHEGMDITKERREHIRDLANSLSTELEDAKWINTDYS